MWRPCHQGEVTSGRQTPAVTPPQATGTSGDRSQGVQEQPAPTTGPGPAEESKGDMAEGHANGGQREDEVRPANGDKAQAGDEGGACEVTGDADSAQTSGSKGSGWGEEESELEEPTNEASCSTDCSQPRRRVHPTGRSTLGKRDSGQRDPGPGHSPKRRCAGGAAEHATKRGLRVPNPNSRGHATKRGLRVPNPNSRGHATKRGLDNWPGFLNSTTKSDLAASTLPSRGPKSGRKCDVTTAFSGVHNKGEQNQNWLPQPCLLRGPKVGGSATSPLHSRGSPTKGTKLQVATSPLPSRGSPKDGIKSKVATPPLLSRRPTSGRNCYVTLAFLRVCSKGDKIKSGCIGGKDKAVDMQPKMTSPKKFYCLRRCTSKRG